MLKTKREVATLSFIVIVASLASFATSPNMAPASGSSIAMANYYPNDGETYEFIDYFLEQTTAVNTNTTVSVSVDGEPPIPMTYQGIRNEIVSSDTVARDWYTWNTTVPAITTPGKHTFQFFSHYYVWQEKDQYWAEFDSYSAVQSFNIARLSATPSQPPTATMNQTFIFIVLTASAAAVFLVLLILALRKHTQGQS